MPFLYILLSIVLLCLFLVWVYPRRRSKHDEHEKDRTSDVHTDATDVHDPYDVPDTEEPTEEPNPMEENKPMEESPTLTDDVPKAHVTKEIPRSIWTYWDSDTIPPLIEKCVSQWKKNCPDYTITILSPLNLSTYLDTDIMALPMSTTPQRTSDFVRLHVLAEHGGIWADASLLLTSSLDWIHEFHTDMVVYSIDHIHTPVTTYPVLENWFIACVPHCDFVNQWKTEFMRINEFESPDLYLKDVEQHGTNVSSIFCTPYLSMHVAAQVVLQRKAYDTTMTVLDAREGPYKHLRFNSTPLSFEQGIPNLCRDTIERVIKFRGIDREFMNSHPELCTCIETRFFV